MNVPPLSLAEEQLERNAHAASAVAAGQCGTLLLVANYDSEVGYAWWLMESFWVRLAEHSAGRFQVLLAYPSVSSLPPAIQAAPLTAVQHDFNPVSFKGVFEQCQFLLRHKVRIIYFSDKDTWHWRYLLYRLCGVRHIIVHDHTPGIRTVSRGLRGRVKRLLHHIRWISVDGAIGCTRFIQRRLNQVNGVPGDRCFVAPNGLSSGSSHFRHTHAPNLHSLFGIPAGRIIMIMTGRASRYKGVDFVLHCIAALPAERRERLQFLFIGDGPDLNQFMAAAVELKIEENCTFGGWRPDVPELLAGADLAIHPSKGEVGYSLSILEYMRAGLPVIVPDNPSVCGATVHGVSGLVFREGDTTAAVAALDRLLCDESLRLRLGAAARLAAEQYSLDATHAGLLQAFDHVTGRS